MNSTNCLHSSDSCLCHKAHLCPLWPSAQSKATHTHTSLWGSFHVHTQTTSAAFAQLSSHSCRTVAVSLNLLFSLSPRKHKWKIQSQSSCGDGEGGQLENQQRPHVWEPLLNRNRAASSLMNWKCQCLAFWLLHSGVQSSPCDSASVLQRMPFLDQPPHWPRPRTTTWEPLEVVSKMYSTCYSKEVSSPGTDLTQAELRMSPGRNSSQTVHVGYVKERCSVPVGPNFGKALVTFVCLWSSQGQNHCTRFVPCQSLLDPKVLWYFVLAVQHHGPEISIVLLRVQNNTKNTRFLWLFQQSNFPLAGLINVF